MNHPLTAIQRIAIALLFSVPGFCVLAAIPAIPQTAFAQDEETPEEREERLANEKKILDNGVGVEELDSIPILDRDPFDRLFLDAESDDATFDIKPLSRGDRTETTGVLVFAMIDEYIEDRKYQVNRKHVVRIMTYPELILAEATRWMEKDAADEFEERDNLVQAFLHYDYLTHHPEFSTRRDVLAATNVYLYTDAYNLIKQRKFAESLAVVEVLYKVDPGYTPAANKPTVKVLLDGTFGKLIDALIEQHDYRLAERYMSDIDYRYKNAFRSTTDRMRKKIEELALEHKKKAEQLAAQNKGREAHEEVRQMRNIAPNLPIGSQIEADILRRFPMVVVGITQRGTRPDPKSLHNWASRRLGKLYYRTLVQYAGQGEDGGIYKFPQGRIERADDWRSIDFVVRDLNARPGMAALDSYFIYDRLQQLADRNSPEYVAAWAQLQQTVNVIDPQRISITLRSPHILPEALLQVPLVPVPDEGDLPPTNGFYQMAESDDDGDMFRPVEVASSDPSAGSARTDAKFVATSATKDAATDVKLPNVLERFYESNEEMVKELKRGDIDVIDRIFPADYRQLKEHPDILVARYAVPTVHMLIPNLENEYLSNAVFRKAILHAINREKILNSEILGNSDLPGCSIVSGPFPMGFGENDPISYGYNVSVGPAIADSFHAAIMLLLADEQVRDTRRAKIKAEKIKAAKERAKQGLPPEDPNAEGADEEKEEEPLPEKKLIIAMPDNAVATFACNLMKQDLKLIGVEAELRKLPPGVTVPPDRDYDLLYAEIVMEEPLVDARSLLLESGLITDLTSPVEHALRELDEASSWAVARRRLHDLHFQCDSETIVLPLWQITEHYAYRTNVRGISKLRARSSSSKPGVTNFYENVDRWRIVPKSSPATNVKKK